MAYNPQMPQMPQQMPQQQQQMPQQMPQQYQNPAANWQQTYQNSSWANRQPMQYQQQQMPQQMPQQYQQQQMPQFSQQQINSFLNFMRSRPMPNFMGDPRYQAQQSQQPVYQPPPTPKARTYMPEIKFTYGGGMTGGLNNSYTSGDASADAWVKARNARSENDRLNLQQREQKTRDLYNQYFSGAA